MPESSPRVLDRTAFFIDGLSASSSRKTAPEGSPGRLVTALQAGDVFARAIIEFWLSLLRAMRRPPRTCDTPRRLHPLGSALFLGHYIVREGADITDLHLNQVSRKHVAVGPLCSHPEHVAGVEGGVFA